VADWFEPHAAKIIAAARNRTIKARFIALTVVLLDCVFYDNSTTTEIWNDEQTDKSIEKVLDPVR
jgi:hypothetical protein